MVQVRGCETSGIVCQIIGNIAKPTKARPRGPLKWTREMWIGTKPQVKSEEWRLPSRIFEVCTSIFAVLTYNLTSFVPSRSSHLQILCALYFVPRILKSVNHNIQQARSTHPLAAETFPILTTIPSRFLSLTCDLWYLLLCNKETKLFIILFDLRTYVFSGLEFKI